MTSFYARVAVSRSEGESESESDSAKTPDRIISVGVLSDNYSYKPGLIAILLSFRS